MTRRVLAHTPNGHGEWHLLVDHLRGTADRAAAFAESFDAAELGRIAGWLHDAGKCSTVFGEYLQACHAAGDKAAKKAFPSRDHKIAGAVRAAALDRALGPLLAATIVGHHGGMRDLAEVRARLQASTASSAVEETLARFDAEIGKPPFPLRAVGPDWTARPPQDTAEREAYRRDVEMLWRLVFSALVDADFLDTEAHFDIDKGRLRGGDRALAGLMERFHAHRRQQITGAPDTPVNRARAEMFSAVLARAGDQPGLYSLAAPTGAGKTQMGLGWALGHAEANGLRRVVTAVPFITVTDQVAGVYRDLLEGDGDHVVLEHHSQVVGDDRAQKLASENWDAPVVVTTTVRLFESLFSNRTSDCRRLHRLARSVIVLDEAQAIPAEVLEPVIDGLRCLVDRFGSSVLIMTATPPALEHVRVTLGRPADPLLPSEDRWVIPFRRTTISDWGTLDHEAVGELVARHRQCLCVVNTITDARAITRAAGPDVLHLSTRLRPADRRSRLGEIRQRLTEGHACRVVSTQLIEAGVDLDFPVVLRALAPLPSLTQADGRCNRNGLLPPGSGTTIVFDLDGGKAPPGAYYGAGARHTKVMLARPGTDVRQPEAIAEWYRLFLTDVGVSLDSRGVQQLRAALRYEATARAFRMIDDDRVSVAVPWPKDHPEAAAVCSVLDRLAAKEPVGRADARALQAVTVAIPRWHASRAETVGLARRVTEHLLECDDLGSYDDNLGLTFSPGPMEVLVW